MPQVRSRYERNIEITKKYTSPRLEKVTGVTCKRLSFPLDGFNFRLGDVFWNTLGVGLPLLGDQLPMTVQLID